MSEMQVDLSIIEKVKKLLKCDKDISDVELAKELFKYRNMFHPDKFLTEKEKKEAHERFIYCSSLYQDLLKYINKEKMEMSITDLQVWEKDFELVNIQQKITVNDNMIQEYKDNLKKARLIIKDLLKQNKELARKRKGEINNELINRYKKRISPKIGITINAFIGLLYILLSNIADLSSRIAEVVKIPKFIIDWLVIIILIFFIIRSMIQILQRSKYVVDVDNIETTYFVKLFKNYFEETIKGGEFTESNIYDFIESYFISKYRKTMFFYKIILRIYDPKYIEALKSIFISYLLEKQLICLANAKKLDREFKVFGASWGSAYLDIIDDEDIDKKFERMDYELKT